MHSYNNFPRFFLPHIALVCTTALLSASLLAEPSNQPVDDACLSDELAEAQQQQSTNGKEAYERVCVTCHQAEGSGIAGVFPPLKNSEWTTNSKVLANIILRGVSGTIYVQDVRYASAMQGFSKELTDQEIVSIIQYIQEDINGQKSSITVEDVAAIRALQLRRISNQSGLEQLQQQYTTKQ